MNEGREAFRQRLAALREDYQALLPERIEAVRRACAEVLAGDGAAAQVTALYQLLHNLAGSGATFGYHEVSDNARRFERFIQSLTTGSPGLTETQRDQLHAYRVLLEAASVPPESSRESSAGWDLRLELSKFPVPAGSEKLIFLVEDDQDLAAHLEYTLRQFGYAVRLFSKLQGLGEAVAQTIPLAILMDLVFPEGDLAGAEIIHAINAEREEPIPVIFISVRDDFDARLHAVRTGTTHYLTKPLDIPALVRTLDEVVLARPSEPYRILIVDDDAELAAFYQVHLEQAGMTVSIVTDPREALAAIPQTRAELVLMDVHMPSCSGLELAAVLRQYEVYTELAIVFLSTESNIDRQLAAMHLGGDEFLTKPIEPWHLVRSVQARVRRARDLRSAKERLASQALRQGEERFRLAIESAPCGMVMVNREGNIVQANAQTEVLFGYTRAELLGQPVELLVPERSRERHRIDLKHFFSDPKPRSMAIGREIQGCRKEGREIFVEVGLSLFQNDEETLVLSTIVDITDRKRAAEQLAQSQKTFFELVERAPFGIYVVDSGFRIAQMNVASQDGAFRNVRPAIGRDFAEAMRILWPEGVAAEIIGHFRHTLETGEPFYSPNFTHRRHDAGTVESYEWELHRIVLPDGQHGVICYYYDSTQLRSAEEALRQSEARYRQLVELIPVAVYTCDAEGVIDYFNDRAAELWGRRPNLGDREEKFCGSFRLCHPDGTCLPHDQCPIVEALAAGKSFRNCDVTIERPDGSCVDVLVNIDPIRDAHGAIVGVINAFADVTERKRAEASLTALKDQLAADLVNMTQLHALSARMVQVGDLATLLQEIVDAAIMTTKADLGNIQLVDRESGALKIVAHRGFEGPFLEFFNVVHDGLAACGTALQRGERVIIEDVAASPVFAGTSALDVMLEANARAVQSTPLFSRSGRLVGMLSTHYHRPHRPSEQELRLLDLLARQAADFIERTQAEEALRESESRFQRMADSAPVLVWIAGTDKRCTYFNKPWLDFTGRAIGQELGYGWAEGVHPDDRAPCLEIYTKEFDARRCFTLEYRLRRHDGEYRWILDRGVPLYGPGGECVGYIGSCLDITERKDMEERLKRADRRKDEFLAMLAHELRNPLAAIRNAIEVIQMLNFAEPKLLWTREIIDRQVHHLTRLVNDLLDVSRLTRGMITLQKEPIELAAVVQQAVEVSRPFIEARSHQLWVSLPSEPIRLEGDLVRLVQVLLNLLNNAAKYTHEGGQIWHEAKRVGNEVAVSVRDNGMGISAALLPHIFDLFIQAERSLDRSQGGLGIGLTLVRRLVEMHGGRVEVRSEGPDRGAEFTVWLPVLVEPIHAEVAGDIQGPSCPLRGVCILIVEDDRAVAESMRMLLDLQGYEVRAVHTGKRALDVARTFRPEIILLDIGLPEMDGYEVARRLRAQAETEKVSLVALTGYGRDEDHTRSKDAGFDVHLVKPVNLTTLNETLCSLLNPKPAGVSSPVGQ